MSISQLETKELRSIPNIFMTLDSIENKGILKKEINQWKKIHKNCSLSLNGQYNFGEILWRESIMDITSRKILKVNTGRRLIDFNRIQTHLGLF